MSRELPPPIGANRVDDADDDDAETFDGTGGLDRFSPRTRLVAAAVVLALAIVAGVIGYRVIAGEDEDGGSGGTAGSWNAIATRDPDSGEITIVDDQGEELDSFDSSPGIGPFDASGPYLLSVVDEQGELIDTRDGGTTAFEVPDDARTQFLAPPTGLVAVAGSLGNIVLVDPEGDEPIDVAATAGLGEPRLNVQRARLDLDERRIAVIDETSFQTILIDLDGGADPVFLPGQLLALDHGTVLTAQVAGDRAEVRFSDLDGTERSTVELDTPVSAQLTASGTAVVLTRDGSLVRVTAGGAEPSELATLDVEEDGAFQALLLPSVERLVYASAEDEVVAIDLAGDEVLREPGAVLPLQAVPVDRVRCISIAEDAGADIGETVAARLFDTESGDQVGDELVAAGNGVLVGAGDGCVVSAIGPGINGSVTSGDGQVELDDASAVALAPDGTTFVERSSDAFVLRSLASPDDDPVELPAGQQAVFVDR